MSRASMRNVEARRMREDALKLQMSHVQEIERIGRVSRVFAFVVRVRMRFRVRMRVRARSGGKG